ncbi:hypothetical protein BDB00DRAFT_846635 [Zychaea mexicana]|uniref:uncharacterized protein n=1 Tax=Zychaea mexicana TaxID=64656 RepID=UPI0022FE3006|nr:uncharacterized protein BDB00DRAFT_846635 [Zychaea mexicana]KAI9488802.1 hypothetical protein BDB00DRAFT_846635 [Zychaea mexicana]
MSPSSSDIPQRATPPSSLKNNSGIESGGGNLRFKPIPNPIYDPETKRNSQENQRSSTTGTAPVTVTNASATTTTFSAATAAVSTPIPGPVNSNKKDDDDDDESEDEFPPLTQRKPREEKWMISSMRRPQQLPVRSQNARIYDRQSTIEDGAAAAQQQQRPKLHIDTNPGAAAHQVMTTVRAQLQQANNFSSPETASTVNPGIRAAPWQQGSNDSQAVTNLYKRATTTATGLGRQNSVNGPRLPESGADIVPPMPGEDYILKHGESAGSDSYQQQQQRYQQQREDTRFNSNVARRHQSTYADMGMMQQQQQQQETRPPPATQNKEHGHFGGRVSIPFFGKKDKQHQQQQPPPMPQQPPMSKQDPTNDQQQAATQSERLSDGAPILHYARSMWAYKAKIPQEMSFNVGDVFAVVHKQPDGWWEAELLDPKRPGRALVPGNYMETIQPSN